LCDSDYRALLHASAAACSYHDKLDEDIELGVLCCHLEQEGARYQRYQRDRGRAQ